MGLSLEGICFEVLFHIFSFLSTKDLCRCSMVCRRWNSALDERESPLLWRQFLQDTPSLSEFLKSRLLRILDGSKAKLIALENAWNREDCSPNIYILDNRLTLHRKPVAQSTDAIRGRCGYLQGLHYWLVTWHGPEFGSGAVVGVATAGEGMHREGYCGLLGSTCESWGWDISERVVKHEGHVISRYPQSDVQIKIGDTIGVTLDMDNRTLSFDRAGCFLGVAFTMLPPRRLYPAVSAVFGNTEVSLVYCGAPLAG